jgi:hypothetical protein
MKDFEKFTTYDTNTGTITSNNTNAKLQEPPSKWIVFIAVESKEEAEELQYTLNENTAYNFDIEKR